MRNGVKWSLQDTDKIGETSGAGKLSCLKQGWWKSWRKACLVRTTGKVRGHLRGGKKLTKNESCL